VGKPRGDVAGRAEDADEDGVADEDCDAEADAEDLEETAAADRRAGLERGFDDARHVGNLLG
jgi:hypothetical protein